MQQQINLLQPPLTRQRQVLSLAQIGMAAAAVVVLLVALSALELWQGHRLEEQRIALVEKQRALQSSVDSLQKTLAQRKPDASLQTELARLDAELQHKQKVLIQIDGREFGNNQGFAPVFVGLARQRLEGLWLTGLHLRSGGQSLDLRGRMMDPALLPRYLQRLREEPSLQGMEFETFLMQRENETSTHIDFDLKSTADKDSRAGRRGRG